MWKSITLHLSRLLQLVCLGMHTNNLISYGSLLLLLHYIIHIAGEPLLLEVEDWYFNVIGQKRCVLIDAWGQTGESNQFCVYLLSSEQCASIVLQNNY